MAKPTLPRPPDAHTPEIELTTTTVLPPAEISQILKNIPHRYPFLLIDRMEACEPGKWVRVVKNVTVSEQFFVGIPIGRRVMPQLLVLEALAQTAGVLCHFSGMMSEIGRSIIFFAGVEHCQFGECPRPGDQLVLECTMKRTLRGVAKLTGKGHIDGTMAISADLSAVVRDM